KKYTTSELLARMAYVYGRKRPTPLPRDLGQFAFFHPDEDYRAEEDHSDDCDDHIRTSNLVLFGRTRMLGSHTYNDEAGGRLLRRAAVGDRVRLQKYGTTLTLTIEQVFPTETGASVRFAEDLAPEFYDENSQEWTILEIVPRAAFVKTAPPWLPPQAAGAAVWLHNFATRAARLVR
ncbi:MAG: hypothetical protein ACM3JG_20680, partial [Thiohalocapsa sp.]